MVALIITWASPARSEVIVVDSFQSWDAGQALNVDAYRQYGELTLMPSVGFYEDLFEESFLKNPWA